MESKTARRFPRCQTQIDQRYAQLREGLRLNAFRNAKQDLVQRTDLGLLKTIATCNEQIGRPPEHADAALIGAACDGALELGNNIGRQNGIHGGPGPQKNDCVSTESIARQSC